MLKFSFVIIIIVASPSHERNINELIVKSYDALNKSLNFITEDIDNFNVDGTFCVAFVQAHLKSLIAKLRDDNIIIIITALLNLAKSIVETAKPKFNSSQVDSIVNEYYVNPNIWVKNVNFRYGKLNQNPIIYRNHSTDLNDMKDFYNYVAKLKESAMLLLMNCNLEVATASQSLDLHECPVNKLCKDCMLSSPKEYDPDYPGYGVTHRLLHLQLARARNCNVDANLYEKLATEECSYIYWEARQNMLLGPIAAFDDLFMEQVTFCGYEGYAEFLRYDWLDHILQIQESHGCFQSVNRFRYKRSSTPMRHGCDSHATGLGAASLSLFLRYLLEKPWMNAYFLE